MSTTDAARESARRPDGQFGVQARTELDPANAGFEDSETGPLPYGSGPRFPMMSWGEAVSVAAHAPDLSSVSKRKGRILFVDRDLAANDLDNQPAVQVFTPHRPTLWRRLTGGRTTYTPESYGSFKHGRLHGWSGTFHTDGSPKEMVWLVASSESSSHPSLKCDNGGWLP